MPGNKPLMTHDGETSLTFCDLAAVTVSVPPLRALLFRFLTAGHGGSCPTATDSFTTISSDWTAAAGFSLGFFFL